MAESHPQPAPPRDGFAARVVTVVAITAAAGILLAILILGLGVLFAAFAGVLFAVVLHTFAEWLRQHTPLRYTWALTAVVLLLLALLVGASWLLGGQVVEQAEQFGAMLPRIVADIESFLQQYGWGQWLLQQAQNGGGGGGAGAGAGDFMAGGMSVLSRLSDLFTYLLVTVFVGLFAAANPSLYVEGIVALTPLDGRARMRELLGELGHVLRWWLLGQGLAMVVIGVSTTIVLWLFGIPLAMVVGLIVGLLGFIPYLGPIIGVLPVALVAGTEGGTTLLWVLLAYTGVQMLEGYVATPLIHERTVYLPPVFTIIMQILLGAVLGAKGIILATPLAAIVLVLSRFYQRDVLGDPEVEVHQSH